MLVSNCQPRDPPSRTVFCPWRARQSHQVSGVSEDLTLSQGATNRRWETGAFGGISPASHDAQNKFRFFTTKASGHGSKFCTPSKHPNPHSTPAAKRDPKTVFTDRHILKVSSPKAAWAASEWAFPEAAKAPAKRRFLWAWSLHPKNRSHGPMIRALFKGGPLLNGFPFGFPSKQSNTRGVSKRRHAGIAQPRVSKSLPLLPADQGYTTTALSAPEAVSSFRQAKVAPKGT